MSAADCQNEILDPMQRLFLPPRSMDETQQGAALREYVDALKDFDGPDLKAAWQKVRNAHMTRSWPVPGAFITAAVSARKDRSPLSGQSHRDKEARERAARWETWLAVCKAPMGKEAVRRNVAWALKCAILNGDKLEQIDLRALVIAKASAERAASKIERGEKIEWKGQMLRMSEENGALAMRMWRNLLVCEENTRQEIERA